MPDADPRAEDRPASRAVRPPPARTAPSTPTGGDGQPARAVQVRRAVPADATELTRLRAVMFEAMGTDGADGWRSACEADLRRLLGGDTLAAFVVDAPDGSGLACGVVGTLDLRLPGPHRPRSPSLVGHVSSMATDARWRHRGLARAALTALLAWFADRGAASATLNATAEGEPLYRSLGFAEPAHPALRLTLAGQGTARRSGSTGFGDQLPASDPNP